MHTNGVHIITQYLTRYSRWKGSSLHSESSSFFRKRLSRATIFFCRKRAFYAKKAITNVKKQIRTFILIVHDLCQTLTPSLTLLFATPWPFWLEGSGCDAVTPALGTDARATLRSNRCQHMEMVEDEGCSTRAEPRTTNFRWIQHWMRISDTFCITIATTYASHGVSWVFFFQ